MTAHNSQGLNCWHEYKHHVFASFIYLPSFCECLARWKPLGCCAPCIWNSIQELCLPLFHIFQTHNDSQTTKTNFCLASRDMEINTRRKWKSYRFHEHEKSMPSGFCGFALSLALSPFFGLVLPSAWLRAIEFHKHNKVHMNSLFLTFPFFPFAETSSEMGSNYARHYFIISPWRRCARQFSHHNKLIDRNCF